MVGRNDAKYPFLRSIGTFGVIENDNLAIHLYGRILWVNLNSRGELYRYLTKKEFAIELLIL
jgi:hypothetical protein